MQPYQFTFSKTVINYHQKDGILFLDGQDPHKFIDSLLVAQEILCDFVQRSLGENPRMDGDTGDFRILEWRIYPADETPMGVAMWGFAFHPFAEYLNSDNSFVEASKFARFSAWHSQLLGDNLDQQVISRYNLDLQEMEYDVVLVLDDLRHHNWWNSDIKIEATLYAQ